MATSIRTVSQPAPTRNSTPLRDRLGAFAGIAFAILFVLFVFLMSSGIPGGEDTNQDIARYYAEQDRFVSATLTLYGFALAGICLLWFLASLRSRLQRDAEAPAVLSSLAYSGGVMCATALITAAAATAAIAASIEFGEETDIQPVVASIGWLASILLTIPAMVGAGVAIIAMSLEILRTGALPRWLAWLGFACAAVVILLGWAFMPMLALPLWSLAAGVSLLRAERVPSTIYQEDVARGQLGTSA